MVSYECQRCGSCCKGPSWLRNLISAKDVQSWKASDRQDILKFICECCNRLKDPETNGSWEKEDCPFLIREGNIARCSVYDARPETCRRFPYWQCDKPDCTEKWHFNPWLWSGKCEASKRFRRDMVRAIEDKIAPM